jgi:hypothetical protein
MRQIEKKGVIQNTQVINPANFENRSEFYQDRKNQKLKYLEGEVMKSCSFQPTILSKDAKPTM